MRLALSGLLFDDAPAAEFAAAAREIGYAGVELRGTRHQLPPDADAARLDRLGELFEGLEIANIASHAGNFALLDEAEALAARQTAHRFLEWAAMLGARSVRIWPGWVAAPEAEPEHWSRAARHLRWCADAAADLGVMVAMEMHHGSLAESAAGANRLLDEIDRPGGGSDSRSGQSDADADAVRGSLGGPGVGPPAARACQGSLACQPYR